MVIKEAQKVYDFIIVGSGPAGYVLADQLQKYTEKSILTIESGSFEAESFDAQQLSTYEASGDLGKEYYPVHNFRRFGGTSNVWNGYCALLEKKSFLKGEWPIPYEELQRFYPLACEYLKLPDQTYKQVETPLPDNENINYRPYYLSEPPVRFGSEEHLKLWKTSSKLDILFNSTVLEVNFEGGRASSLQVMSNLTKKVSSVKAQYIILACGGVQNARLLKLSKLPREAGVLPVGKYFAEHPHIYTCIPTIFDWEARQKLVNHELENIVHVFSLSDQYTLKSDLISGVIQLQAAKEDTDVLLGKSRTVWRSQATMRSELKPSAENLVELGQERDLFNQKVAKIHLEFSKEQVHAFLKHFSTELARSGVGRMGNIDPQFTITGGGHMLGTTRMGSDVKTSVVDENCKVHFTDNLFVAGSSIFTNGETANPTLSIVAFAARLGQFLARL